MIISSCADKLRCPYCEGMHGSTQWPTSGDSVPFYYQKEPGSFNLKVTCPYCGEAWYVVWDDDPGPTVQLLGPAGGTNLGKPTEVGRDSACTLTDLTQEGTAAEVVNGEDKARVATMVKTLIAVAMADGNVDSKERAILDAFVSEKGLDQKDLEELFTQKPRIERALLPNSLPEKRRLLIELVKMANADGHIDDGERSIIARIAKTLDMDREEVRSCVKQAQGAARERTAAKRLDKAMRELADIAQQDGRVGHPIGTQILQRELQGLQDNLAAAVDALQKAGDGGAKSIGSHDVGVGLGRLCEDTLHNPNWALQKNVGTDRCRTRVAQVLRSIEEIAKKLSRAPEGDAPQSTAAETANKHEDLSPALEKGNLQAVKHYLDAGGDPNISVDDGSLPLHKAIRYGHPDIAKLLIRSGADVNARDKWRDAPLHLAVVSLGPGGRCLPDVAQLLIKQGADVNAQGAGNWPPLLCATDNFQTEMATLLRKHGARG